jgi:NAD+ diphosphatase
VAQVVSSGTPSAPRYVHAVAPSAAPAARAVLFAFRGPLMAVLGDAEDARLPDGASGLDGPRRQYLGTLDGADAWSLELPVDGPLPDGIDLRDLRTLHAQLDGETWGVAGRAFQVVQWDRTHQHCGACGGATVVVAGERARRCPGCDLSFYPRLAPAVIVAVTRGDQLLLARGPGTRGRRYSVLAGFVEPGESLEATVAREIHEEVGIEVRDVRYFGSQAWPFPNSLMVGFTARWASGEIAPDGVEILEAAWFRAGDLPNIPPRISISRELIDWFVSGAPRP